MKVSNLSQLTKLDPEDIHKAPGDLQRQYKRKRLIKKFLWWSLSEKKRWSQSNNEERIIVKRQYAYARLLTAFGVFSNFAIYNCFLTGIYNFRSTELLDMRRIPFVFKISISSLFAYAMCSRLWDNNIQEAELYQVALKYRERYDKDIASKIQHQNNLNSDNTNQNVGQQAKKEGSTGTKGLQIA